MAWVPTQLVVFEGPYSLLKKASQKLCHKRTVGIVCYLQCWQQEGKFGKSAPVQAVNSPLCCAGHPGSSIFSSLS